MSHKLVSFGLLLTLFWISPADTIASVEASKTRRHSAGSTNPVLWRDPADIAQRNLFWGPGGKKHAPRGTVFSFVEENRAASNPKFLVRDANGVEWKVKLGAEAKPETAATRLVWAAGYFADEDYYLPEIRVTGLPAKVKRGKQFLGPNGIMYGARLERHHSGHKNVGNWAWKDNPFLDDRRLNGLRVLMAVMNSWDLKDENNDILQSKERPESIYTVSDLGAAFGTTGFARSQAKAKGNLGQYERSKFITHVTPQYVDFATPARPSFWWLYDVTAFRRRVRLEELGKRIPRADARWMGQVLARLSRHQIADAFRAAGYSPSEVNGFTTVVERRIAELRRL